MQTPSLLARFRRKIVFVQEEPGYLAVLILGVLFLMFTPKAGCSFQDAPAESPAPSEGGH